MAEALSGGRWRALALSEDLSAERPSGRRTIGQDYVLFRDAAGAPRVLADQCAHRRAPLSLGQVTADGLLQCPYHGWAYDGASGVCKVIPNFAAEERVPERYRVEAFAAAERDGFVYVWSGSAETANEALLPALSASVGEQRWTGARLLVIPQPSFIGALLDAPGVVLQIDGLRIVDGFQYGDPVLRDGLVTVEFGVARPGGRKSLRGLPADLPLSLSITAAPDGAAFAELKSDVGATLAAVLIGAAPASEAVTSVIWRGAGAPTAEGARRPAPRIVVRERIDPAALLAVKPNASPIWTGHAGTALSAAA